MAHFLPRFERVLRNPAAYQSVWGEEVGRVRDGAALLSGPQCSLTPVEELGLVVVRAPRALHYYALFGAAATACKSADVVLAVYPKNRYELEQKYTGFVRIFSRKVAGWRGGGPAGSHSRLALLQSSGTAIAAPLFSREGLATYFPVAAMALPLKSRSQRLKLCRARKGFIACGVAALTPPSTLHSGLAAHRHGAADQAPERAGGLGNPDVDRRPHY